jgi:uncharacterized protein (DUF342 family)
MIKFPEFQRIMKQQLEADRLIRAVETSGDTLDKALNEAATLLNLSVRQLDYEIIERGFPGFLGAAKKEWQIRAYKRFTTKEQATVQAIANSLTKTVTEQIVDKDGEFFVHLFDDGVKLKVTPPSGAGKPVNLAHVRHILKMRNVSEIFEDTLKRTVQESQNVYVHIGKFERKMINDCMVQATVLDQDMKAFISVIPPGPGGCDPSANTIMAVLRANRVIFGFDDETINDFVDRPIYKTPILVAEGRKPVNGRDAYIQYNFEIDDTSKRKIEEKSDGSVDFKDKNMVQNVVKDQPLAKKIPAEQGVDGKTVLGSYLPASNGKDSELQLGANVHLDTDGETILADINGQVLLVNGKISVEPILNIQGNVDIKTGNIIFLGTVIINGSVEDGFVVKAEGNIEVKGTIGKAEVEAEGDIKAYKGITGRNGGMIKAGKSVYASFVENATVDAGDSVIVSDGIINSQVVARRILCQGRRANIVGGYLRATEEISAKVIGSAVSGTETICETGFDPKLKAELDELLAKKIVLDKALNDIKLNLETLSKLKKFMDELPEDKGTAMIDLLTKRKQLMDESKQIHDSIVQKQTEMNEAAGLAIISASERILPGVKIILRDKIEKIQTEYKKVAFVLENDMIRPRPYEENKDGMEDIARDKSAEGLPVPQKILLNSISSSSLSSPKSGE